MMRSNHGTQPPSQTPEGYLWVGQVGRPHGVRGAFFLKTVDNRADWPGYRELLVQRGSGDMTCKVEKSYQSGGKLVLQLQGISSRDACEELYDSWLFVSRNEIVLDEHEYVVDDLIGCTVEVEGREGVFGVVLAVHNFGAQETLEIQKHNSSATVLFPFLDAFIVSIDEDLKQIVIKDEEVFLDEQQ